MNLLRYCYDSTTATDVPKTAKLALAYVDGRYANLRPMRAWLGKKARIVTVTVLGDIDADMCDCETGDLTPETAAKWAHHKRTARKGFPTIYCLDSQHTTVIAACKQRGLILHKHYNLFVANYDGQRVLPAYAVGKQFADPKGTGHHYDASVVRPYWRGVDRKIRRVIAPLPPKTVPAPTTPTQGDNMNTLRTLLRAGASWVKNHPKVVRHEITVFVAALASQPVVHTFLGGKSAAVLIGVLSAAALTAARKIAKA